MDMVNTCSLQTGEDVGVATPGAPPTQNGPEYLELKDKVLADELDLQQEGAGQQLPADCTPIRGLGPGSLPW